MSTSMTNRERILAIMDGKSPDRIPWVPRPVVWHTAQSRAGALPEHLQGLSLREVEHVLRMGTPAREGQIYTTEQRGDVEVETRAEGESRIIEYRTPAGTVSIRTQTSAEHEAIGIGALEVEHMIKGPADYDAVEYLIENTHYQPCYDRYLDYEAEIGDDGYPLVSTGDCPFHHFLQKLAGYECGYYQLADHRDRVERLMAKMEELDRERLWPIVADSPARLILNGVHFDSMMTPAPLFEKYITPYYRDFSDLLHGRDKILAMHADNDSSLILEQIRDAGFDMAETFTTEPQVTCTLAQAKQVWQNDVIIWGGVPSVILEESYSEAEFERYMREIFHAVAPGEAFIMGVADNIMPGAQLSRLERIAEMVEEWGDYPIDTDKIAATG